MLVAECRAIVFSRDDGCVAPRLDPDAGPCFGKDGRPIVKGAWDGHEMDYVRHPTLQHHRDPEAHVMVCAGHHRGVGPNKGRQWATSHRDVLRAHLRKLYPALW